MLATAQSNLCSRELFGIKDEAGGPGLFRVEREVTFGGYIAGDRGKACRSGYGHGVRGSNLECSISRLVFELDR